MTITSEATAGYVVLTGNIEPEDGGFNAYCLELGVATCGDSVEEVLDGLAEAIQVYLEDWEDPEDLAGMLRENRVEIKTGPLPSGPVAASLPVGKTGRVYVLPVPAPVAV